MQRVWEDICKKWPEKLTCTKKPKSTSTVTVINCGPDNSKNVKDNVRSSASCVDNKGYKEEAVRPCEVEEKDHRPVTDRHT